LDYLNDFRYCKLVNIHEYNQRNIDEKVKHCHLHELVNIFLNNHLHKLMHIEQECEHFRGEFHKHLLSILGNKHMFHYCTNQHYYNHQCKFLKCNHLNHILVHTNMFHQGKCRDLSNF